MNRLILALAGAIVVAACSEARDRRVPAAENSASQPDLTLPDSAALASRGERPVSPVEQQVVRAPEKKKPVTPRPVAPRRKRSARPAPPAPDTTTRGYAPQAATDTAAINSPRDTNAAAGAPDTSGSKPDTIRTASADTVMTTDSVSPTAGVSPTTSPATTRTLPVGTEIHAALDDSIDSRHDSTGQTVSAHVMENVTGSDGRTLIPAGAPVRLTVTRITPAKSKGSQGALELRADGIALNGQLRSVKADVRPVPRELRGRGVTGSEAAKVGVGAAGGAVLGRVLGGNTKGAVIGGVVGAAGGAVVASQTATRDVVVKAKTPVVLVLTEPLTAP
jgi:glycine zipper 2TM protein